MRAEPVEGLPGEAGPCGRSQGRGQRKGSRSEAAGAHGRAAEGCVEPSEEPEGGGANGRARLGSHGDRAGVGRADKAVLPRLAGHPYSTTFPRLLCPPFLSR